MKLIKLLFVLFFNLNLCLAQKVYNYSSFTEHFDTKKWTQQYQRELDEEGILIQKKEYHALSIAVYGLMNYRDFVDTGDSSCYYHMVNQYKYFCDSSKIDVIDGGKGIGLPYKFNFHDLKASWYSGMTQGFAVSFLLRYYNLTNDKEALHKVEQMVYFMLRPEKEGGAIGKTPEGYTFIEEYPNSKAKPQVLNGFINGLIGIKEYLNYFPKDTLAKRIHDESYEAMINTFEKYDTPNWTNYDRRHSRCSNQYIRYEITELEQLYNIYHDYRLMEQIMIWSYYSYNKIDKNLHFYKNPNYQYSLPLLNENGTLSNKTFSFEASFENTKDFVIYRKSKKQKASKIKKNKKYVLEMPDSCYVANLYFSKDISKSDFEFYSDGKKLNNQTLSIKIDSNCVTVSSSLKFKDVNFRYSKSDLKKIKIIDIEYYSGKGFANSRFVFHKIKNIKYLEKGKKYSIDCGVQNSLNGRLFYRYATKKSYVNRSIYKRQNSISVMQPTFIPKETGYYEFFISTPNLPEIILIEPSFSLVK